VTSYRTCYTGHATIRVSKEWVDDEWNDTDVLCHLASHVQALGEGSPVSEDVEVRQGPWAVV